MPMNLNDHGGGVALTAAQFAELKEYLAPVREVALLVLAQRRDAPTIGVGGQTPASADTSDASASQVA